jgi:hypothetical protein
MRRPRPRHRSHLHRRRDHQSPRPAGRATATAAGAAPGKSRHASGCCAARAAGPPASGSIAECRSPHTAYISGDRPSFLGSPSPRVGRSGGSAGPAPPVPRARGRHRGDGTRRTANDRRSHPAARRGSADTCEAPRNARTNRQHSCGRARYAGGTASTQALLRGLDASHGDDRADKSQRARATTERSEPQPQGTRSGRTQLTRRR